jgi:signal transduction protein with GAF and PtsI domain
MQCNKCLGLFQKISLVYSSPIEANEKLQLMCKTITEAFDLKGCYFRMISHDSKKLELVASYGLSDKFLNKGPVDTDKSVSEALTGETVYIKDVANDPKLQYPNETREEGIIGLLTVPLVNRGQTLGVMRISTKDDRVFSEQELDIISVAACFSANLITSYQFKSIWRKVRETTHSSLDINKVLDNIVEVITEELRAKGCTIRLYDPVTSELRLKASFGLSDSYLQKGTVLADENITNAKGSNCIAIFDVSKDDRVQYPKDAVAEGISSLLSVPLEVYGKLIGVLRLYTNRPYEFSDDEIYLMKSIGDQCALAIRDAQQYSGMKDKYNYLVEDFHHWFDDMYSAAGSFTKKK